MSKAGMSGPMSRSGSGYLHPKPSTSTNDLVQLWHHRDMDARKKEIKARAASRDARARATRRAEQERDQSDADIQRRRDQIYSDMQQLWGKGSCPRQHSAGPKDKRTVREVLPDAAQELRAAAYRSLIGGEVSSRAHEEVMTAAENAASNASVMFSQDRDAETVKIDSPEAAQRPPSPAAARHPPSPEAARRPPSPEAARRDRRRAAAERGHAVPPSPEAVQRPPSPEAVQRPPSPEPAPRSPNPEAAQRLTSTEVTRRSPPRRLERRPSAAFAASEIFAPEVMNALNQPFLDAQEDAVIRTFTRNVQRRAQRAQSADRQRLQSNADHRLRKDSHAATMANLRQELDDEQYKVRTPQLQQDHPLQPNLHPHPHLQPAGCLPLSLWPATAS